MLDFVIDTTKGGCERCIVGFNTLECIHKQHVCRYGRQGYYMLQEIVQEDKPGGSTPTQYALPPNAKDLQDLIEYREMNFAMGNIFKAAYRLGTCDHSDRERDLRKIIWFAERELGRKHETDDGA